MNQSHLADAYSLLEHGDLEAAAEAFGTLTQDPLLRCRAEIGLGAVAMARGDTDQAITHLKAAVAADPGSVDALSALGAAFVDAGHAGKATTILAEAVKRHPAALEPRLHLVSAFVGAGRPDEARHVATETATAFPTAFEAWRAKGRAERVAGDSEAAKASFERAREIAPDHAGTLNDLGVTCRALTQYEAAAKHYRAAIAADPDLAVAHANLGNVLDLMEQPEDAEVCLRRALELDPAADDTAYNLACLLTKLEKPGEAVPLLESVVARAPQRWDAWTNLGVARLDSGDIDRAEEALRHALTLKPGNPEARYNLAWLLLLTGRHQDGWAEFESRWDLPEFSSERSELDVPVWQGDALGGRTLLLSAEQGFGDAIQFIRFAADIDKGGGKIVLECRAPLVRLLTQAAGLDEVRASGSSTNDADVQLPLMSLPHRLGHQGARREDAAGYLVAPVAPDHLTLPPSDRRRIGLVWAGSPDNKIDRRRRMKVTDFVPLFEATDADFVSLQIGPGAAEASAFPASRVAFAADGQVTDFADTAALIGQLDLVIGVDTAVMHLAGAMGVPAWIILPLMPDYRWGLGSDSTPWYDSARLFRQSQRGSWSGVIADICTALSSW